MVVRKYTYLIETNLKATLRKTLHDFSVISWISCQRYSSFLQRVLRTSPGLDKARWLKFCIGYVQEKLSAREQGFLKFHNIDLKIENFDRFENRSFVIFWMSGNTQGI